MRLFHRFLCSSTLVLTIPACSGEVFIASMPDGGDASSPPPDGNPGPGPDGSTEASTEASTDGSGGGGSCTTSSDCTANEICGFPETPACSATGRCFPPPGAVCAAYGPGCGCDGTEVNLICNGLPSGYVTKPLLHTGACTDASATSDAGKGVDSGAPCSTTADCPPSDVCAFPMADGCSAHGECVALPTVVCDAYAAGCACDGTEINITCTGLPNGDVTKPLKHTGSCGDGG
jgi:hypothetical protein